MHFKSFGALTGTPEALKQLITRKDCEMKELTPGKPLVLCNVCLRKERERGYLNDKTEDSK